MKICYSHYDAEKIASVWEAFGYETEIRMMPGTNNTYIVEWWEA